MHPCRHTRFLRWTIAVVVFHFVALLVLADCPVLHEKLHHHHNDKDVAPHECAVSLISDGVCESGFAPLLAPKPELPVPFSLVCLPVTPRRALALGGQSYGRAPPV